MTTATRRRTMPRLFLSMLVLLALLSALGCDCKEGDTTAAFGPECGENTTADTQVDGSNALGGGGTLIFSDVSANSIRRLEGVSDLNTAAVTAPPVTGARTRMTRPGYLSMHPTSNELIVCDEGSIAVLFFADPLSITGDVPPARILTGKNTELVAPEQAFINTESDELYVLDQGGNRVLVFPAAASITADVAPLRRIGGPSSGIFNPVAFIVRPSIDEMTVINPTEILTFKNLSTLNGDPNPSGRVTGDATTFQNLAYGDFDSSNSLILVDRGTRSILYFEDFVSDQNNQVPTRVVQGANTGITDPGQFVLTGSGNMYLANGTNILFFEGVKDLVGNVFPDRKLSALEPPSQSIQGLLAP